MSYTCRPKDEVLRLVQRPLASLLLPRVSPLCIHMRTDDKFAWDPSTGEHVSNQTRVREILQGPTQQLLTCAQVRQSLGLGLFFSFFFFRGLGFAPFLPFFSSHVRKKKGQTLAHTDRILSVSSRCARALVLGFQGVGCGPFMLLPLSSLLGSAICVSSLFVSLVLNTYIPGSWAGRSSLGASQICSDTYSCIVVSLYCSAESDRALGFGRQQKHVALHVRPTRPIDDGSGEASPGQDTCTHEFIPIACTPSYAPNACVPDFAGMALQM